MTDRRRNSLSLLWLGLSLIGAASLVVVIPRTHGLDLMAYWSVDLAHPYARTIGIQSPMPAFLYGPPVALVMSPLHLLAWPVAKLVWLGLQLAALAYIGRRWMFALLCFPPVWGDLIYGNIYLLLTAMIVAARRHPNAWVFGLLTKITPGVGLAWLVGRREWWMLARALGVLAVIVGASFIVQGPGAWLEWVAMLGRVVSGPPPTDALFVPLAPRIVVATVVLLWAGSRGYWWPVPIAVGLAMPTLWQSALIPLLALGDRQGRVAALHRGEVDRPRRDAGVEQMVGRAVDVDGAPEGALLIEARA